MTKTSKSFIPYLLSFITAIILMSGAFIVNASAATYQDGDYYYTISNGNAIITGYTGTSPTIRIPSSVYHSDYGDIDVVAIGNYAFNGNKVIKNVTIPRGITTIGDWAFEYCTVQSVDIPETVTTIGNEAFSFSALTTIDIPDSVTTLGSEAFRGCSQLTTVTIPGSIKNVGYSAFYDNGSLVSAKVSEGVEVLGSSAFAYCPKLSTVTLPSTLTEIGDSAFMNCTSLVSISLPSKLSAISAQCFYGCISLKTATIPSGVGGIMASAFSGCTSLTKIDIPGSVKSVGKSAFSGCASLESAIVRGGITRIKEYAFSNCKSLTTVTLTNTITTIDSYAFEGSGITKVTIPTGMEYIDYRVFADCTKLTSVTIPSNIKSIEGEAFSGCKALTSIAIPSSVTSIGAGAFAYSGLKGITIPESVTKLGGSVFYECKSLLKVKLPSKITSIPAKLFYNCSALVEANIPANVETVNDYAYYGCSAFTSFTIPTNVKAIGEYSFEGCSGLKSISISPSITVIPYHAFANCSSLTSVKVPASVVRLETSCFRNCTALTNASLPAGLTIVGEDAFYGCSKLSGIVIPRDVTTVGYGAFRKCSALRYVALDTKVLSIGNYCFAEDSMIKDVYYTGYAAQWAEINIGYGNSCLTNAVMHYRSKGPVSPELPTLKAVPDNGFVTLSWNAVSGATKYRVCYRLKGANTWTTNDTTAKAYKVSGLTNGRTYQFVVLAGNSYGWSSYSATDIKTATPISALVLPTLKATAGDTKISLSWGAVKGATKYRVCYRLNGAATWTTKETTTTSYTISGLTNGKKYDVLVLSGNGYAWSTWTNSNIKYVTPLGAPALPSVRVSAGDGRVALAWGKVAGATKYRVSYRLTGANTWTSTDITATSYAITGLTNGRKYDILVLAGNSVAWSKWTNTNILNATPVAVVPALPTVKTVAGDSKVSLSWNTVSGAVKYRVFYRLTGANSWTTKDITTTSYTITGLTNGRKYDILVLAGSASSWSKWTNTDIINATPVSAATVPALPTVRYSAGNARVALAWNAVSGATKYRVCYRLKGATSWTIKEVTSTNFAIESLTNGKEYEILVLSGNTAGWSKWTASNILTVTPKA